MSQSIFQVRPLDSGKGWAIDEYDGRGAWQHSVPIWGEVAEKIAQHEELGTRNPQEVTCKKCLIMMRRDDHADHWELTNG